jgi:predicted nucleic acid-binding protein
VIATDRVVVDASVAVKWYVPEVGSERAARLLGGGARLLAPELIVAEFGNVLWKKVERRELSDDEATTIAETFLSSGAVAIHPLGPLLRAALDLAVRFHHPVYDAYYLALAVADNCSFVTADEQLVLALAGTPLTPYIARL